VRAEFAYDAGGLGKGGEVALYVDGTPSGKGRIDSTQPFIFSGDEPTDVGTETGTTVTDEYPARDSTFTGTIKWVRLETGLDSHDHLIDPDHLVHIAMMREEQRIRGALARTTRASVANAGGHQSLARRSRPKRHTPRHSNPRRSREFQWSVVRICLG
jgi:hypothetical protein